jgi:omega-6 fatty acid desaturase (delta-12 desaturase)
MCLPVKEAPFTFADLKNAIPPHCFKRSLWRSFSYVVCDLVLVASMYQMTNYFDLAAEHHWAAPYVLWPMYWWWQGAVLTGLWVIAHECGHRAFSDNIAIGDAVGIVLHSALLVPYHPWRISHAKHHKNTNSMEGDEVFVPYTRSQMDGHPSHADEMPGPLEFVTRVCQIAKMLLFGWPAYLAGHVTGHPYEQPTNHFAPSSPIFNAKDKSDVIVSDIALMAVVATLGYLGQTVGWFWLLKVYFIPYLVVNMWLVMITDLQHTDPRLPHYRGDDFSWIKGALCTMDRDYGVMNVLHHHIGDTHVTHHLFSKMPHYHAEEATKAIRPILGEYYLVDDVSPGLRGIAEALYKTAMHCRFVEDEGGVLWWNRFLTDENGVVGAMKKEA